MCSWMLWRSWPPCHPRKLFLKLRPNGTELSVVKGAVLLPILRRRDIL